MLFPKVANRPSKVAKIGAVWKVTTMSGDHALLMLLSTIRSRTAFFAPHLIENSQGTNTPARAWYIHTMLPFLIVMVALFADSSVCSGILMYAYIFASLISSYIVVYAAIKLVYVSMTAVKNQDSYQRFNIALYRMLLSTVANTLTLMLALLMVELFGNSEAEWLIAFLIVGGIASIGAHISIVSVLRFMPSQLSCKAQVLRRLGALVRACCITSTGYMVTLAQLTSFSSVVVFGCAITYYCAFS